ncbi:SusC/RagA family TonB-linked outer membrane protein [Fulvivirgaceae bacterium BMA12]|uniref:SusC/RagA family TonB-linked outer membrane protein n=1 Tax=Agaribacillus aureus TaxID=3051825 RepID=A0ABT8L601_9BACT|nr:SusC/RagA family TonB-linked outer membrane protein [Fulvivirgaceae bacterium BMA12]
MHENLQYYRKILLLIPFVFFGSYVKAQNLSYVPAEQMNLRDTYQDKRTQSLRKVLEKIKKEYQVTFGYQDRLVQGKSVAPGSWEGKELDQILESILTPHGLKYKKLDDLHYVIKAKKSSKRKIGKLAKKRLSTNLDVEKLNNTTTVEASAELLKMREATVSGKVISEVGEALPGVNILIKGTDQGTITDIDGNFQLTVPEDAVLKISYIGYLTQEIAVNGRTFIEITMEPDLAKLEEVVVIGYGSTEQKDITGSVASFDSKALERQPANNIMELMRSALPGLNVGLSTNANGTSNLEVRGPTSLGANNSPLLVVDDVIFQGDISSINPADIERVNVLKDASAAAVYGSRAAAGVIIITTKKGSTGKPTINVSSSVGLARAGVIEDVYGPGEYLDYKGDVFEQIDAGSPVGYYDNPGNLPAGVTLNDWLDYDGLAGSGTDPVDIWLNRMQMSEIEIENFKAGRVLDWKDIIFQTGLRTNNTISVSGKTDKLSYYTSLGYVKNEGVLLYEEYEALRGRLNLEMDVTDFLSVGLNLQGSSQEEPFQSGNDNTLPPHLQIYGRQSPYGSLFYDDGTFRHLPYDDALAGNPFLYEYEDNLYKRREVFSNLYAKVQLPLGFSYRLNWSNRSHFIQDYRFTPAIASLGEGGDVGSRRDGFQRRWMVDNIVSWNKTFADIHSFDVTFLYNVEEAETFNSIQSNSDFSPNDNLSYHNLSIGSNPNLGNNDTRSTADAMMGRLNYGLLDRYYLTLTLRRDGYSAFGVNNPRATFPAVSFAWRLSDEPFLNNDLFDNLKLRLSWGKNGNRDIGVYSALSRLGGTSYIYDRSTVVGVNATDLANTDLKWETTASYNAGVDFGMMGSRIFGSVDIYHSVTTDLLLERTLPVITGYSDVFANLGEVQNSGLEIVLNSVNIDRNGFKWNSNLSFWYNRNKINHLYGDMVDVFDENGNVIGQREEDDIENNWYIGHAVDEIFDYKILGIWQQGEEDEAAVYGRVPGDIKLQDVNGDSLINFDDQVFQGFDQPRYRISLRNDLTYKNFDFSILMNALLDYKGGNNEHFNRRVQQQRLNKIKTPYWTENNPSNEWARLDSKNSSPATSWYDDKSFMRIQNITLGYTIPQKILEKWDIQSLRVYANVQNLPAFTFGGWDYRWDVETSLPTPLIATFGFDLSF